MAISTLPPNFFDMLGPEALRMSLQRLMGEMEAEQTQAKEGAAGAFSQLMGAQQAPTPEIDPRASGVQQLFGDVASVISQRPEHAQRSREDIMAQRAQLAQQRGENLQILRDRYIAAAERVGKVDPIKEMDYRKKADVLMKQLEAGHQENLQTQQDTAAMERTKEQNKGALAVANVNSQAEMMRWLASGAGAEDKTTMTPDKRTERLTAIRGTFLNEKSKGVTKQSLPIYLESVLAVPPHGKQSEAQWTSEVSEMILAAKRTKKLDKADVARILRARAIHFAAPAANTTATPEDVDVDAPAVDGLMELVNKLRGKSRAEVIRWLRENKPQDVDPAELLQQLFAPPAAPRLGGFQPAP